MKRKIAMVGLSITLLFTACHNKQEDTSTAKGNQEEADVVVIEESKPKKPEFIDITISAVGDIIVHSPQLTAQYFDDTYCFKNNFEFVKPYLQSADLMLGNLEITFGGSDLGYAGYPMFNTPDALAKALKQAGFHGLATSNNHTLDTGKAGVIRTIDVVKENSLIPFGTRRNTEEQSFSIIDIKGVKVGLSAFTYETPRYGDFKTINAIPIPKDTEALIDTFSYEYLDEDLLKMKNRVEEMRANGAEVICFYLHWGHEYHKKPNPYQKKIAYELAEYGVDIIFGSHPHVLQPIEIIEAEENGKSNSTLVVYSLGNFLSNQRYEYLNNRSTEDGLIINVTLRKNLLNNDIQFNKISFVPTWVHKYRKNGRAVYEIIPLLDVLENKEEYNLISNDSIWRAENSKASTVAIIEDELNGVTAETPLYQKERYNYWHQYKLN
ncbi:CapA family protein [Alkaliphilus pronyensis]|uniref:CapA family protein n=1 Tax=Alkaliphilus pronyensis TaxID=1482732 RepID=A0A6I0FGI0_9FIRM|nr:CapA family protein [Alkaliphilus pronyensis]KAB3535331.1 CapA family protein [Alkaliphilus pronyensis]